MMLGAVRPPQGRGWVDVRRGVERGCRGLGEEGRGKRCMVLGEEYGGEGVDGAGDRWMGEGKWVGGGLRGGRRPAHDVSLSLSKSPPNEIRCRTLTTAE